MKNINDITLSEQVQNVTCSFSWLGTSAPIKHGRGPNLHLSDTPHTFIQGKKKEERNKSLITTK